MQPLFEATGWSLPSSIAPQKSKKGNKKASNNTSTNPSKPNNNQQEQQQEESVSKQADQLQDQLDRLNKKNNNNSNNNEPKQQQQKNKNKNKRQRQQQKGQQQQQQQPEEKVDQDQEQTQNAPPAKKVKLNEKKNEEPLKEDNTPLPSTESQPVVNQEGNKLTKKQKKNAKKQQQQEVKKDQEEKETVTLSTHDEKVTKKQEKKQITNDQKAKLQQLLAKKEDKKQQQQPEKKPQPIKQTQLEKNSITKSNTSKLTPLQQKMKEKLSGARFRWLNEQLYTTKGDESFTLFKEKPELFDEYHQGFRHQVESWPVNPVDVIVKQLSKLPAGTVIADLGCGDAKIAHTLKKQKVLSFDMVSKNEKVVACDISNIPLPEGFVDVAVFSLALMGTNYLDFLKEARRILKPGGELKIAEVVSRFTDVEEFIELLEQLGFEFIDKDDSNKMFIMFYFTKQEVDVDDQIDKEMLEGLSKAQKRALKKGAGVHVNQNKLQKKSEKLLKPCVYKKR